MAIGIVNNRIEGTRITVWDVYYYQTKAYPRAEICTTLSLSLDELAAAEKFIAENGEFVERVHQEIEERNRRGNPPELQAQLDAGHERFLQLVKKLKAQRNGEHADEGTASGHQHSGTLPGVDVDLRER